MNELKQESIFVPINQSHHIHLKHFWSKLDGPVCLLIHGSIENGRIFYSLSGKGLGPFLAQKGFDVYIGDLRGRGLSTPKINRHSSFGQTESITEDIPAMVEKIIQLRGKSPQHWIAHSWGGVLLLSSIARFPHLLNQLKSIIFFSTKRKILTSTREKKVKIDLFWNTFSPLMTNLFGYLPARELGVGSDNETRKSHQQCKQWIGTDSQWVDSEDRFDYAEQLKHLTLPPILSLTGSSDYCLGHPYDIFEFLRELNTVNHTFKILGQKNGSLHNYDHINILTHPDSINDHFLMVNQWLRRHS